MWQMTWDEMLNDAYPPKAETNPVNGLTSYMCPVCGSFVGMHSSGKLIEKGWHYKREACQNGHKVNWWNE